MKRLFKYLGYIIRSKSKYRVHSPFLYGFIKEVLNDRGQYYAYSEVEALRHRLLRDKRQIEVIDFGAGSKVMKPNKRLVRDIVKYSSVSPKYGQLLFRIVNRFSPQNILELGTASGVSTAYMAKANSKAAIITLEGSESVAALAKENMETLGIDNVKIVAGEFSDTIEQALAELKSLNLAFIDGNHRKNATIAYFNKMLGSINDKSILIFDDIHWSGEMEEAWHIICGHKEVTLSLDLFFIGIIFFNKQLQKEHFEVYF